jgi:hypothetical protein
MMFGWKHFTEPNNGGKRLFPSQIHREERSIGMIPSIGGMKQAF